MDEPLGSTETCQPLPHCQRLELRWQANVPGRVRFAVAALVASIILTIATAASHAADAIDASDAFFASDHIAELRIAVPEAESSKLNGEKRVYVHATIEENGQTKYADVGLKLKGAAGSFREFNDRPALTINVNKFNKSQVFHGLDKFHLNNSVQDETYLHELVCSELFRAAGVPATRVTHARVWINGRDLGLYVVKEGFDKRWLARHFPDASGNLYDGGFCQEIDAELERDSGSGPEDRADLKALVEACHLSDPDARYAAVAEQLDVEAMLSFVAMELMTCHWDGYSQSRNNYRLYFEPKSHKAYFLPHGMDQMFGNTGASILDTPPALVAATVMQKPEWRARYRERVNELLPLFSPPDRMLATVDRIHGRLRPVLAAMSPEAAQEYGERVGQFKEQLIARSENLVEQHLLPEPQPLEFDERGVARITDWYTASESDNAELDEVELNGGRAALHIQAADEGPSVGSWRAKVLLPAGNYILGGKVRTKNVAALEDDEKGRGAGLRISGSERQNQLTGSSDFKLLKFEFTVEEPTRQVILVAELRASRGQAWFDAGSLRLVKKTE